MLTFYRLLLWYFLSAPFPLTTYPPLSQTGGNRGIGLTISKAIAAAGGNVAIIYRSSPTAAQAAEEIAKEYGVKTKAHQADVSDRRKVRSVWEGILQDFGDVHGVVAVWFMFP